MLWNPSINNNKIPWGETEDEYATFGFGYSFGSSNSMTIVYEEYLIYDVISMIGSVGGTLGMCIGFSFTGVLSILMKMIKNGICSILKKQ